MICCFFSIAFVAPLFPLYLRWFSIWGWQVLKVLSCVWVFPTLQHLSMLAREKIECFKVVFKKYYKGREVRWNTIWRETVASSMCHKVLSGRYDCTYGSPLLHAKSCFISPHFLCTHQTEPYTECSMRSRIIFGKYSQFWISLTVRFSAEKNHALSSCFDFLARHRKHWIA